MKRIILILVFISCGLTALPASDTESKYYLAAREKSLAGENVKPKVFVNDNCELTASWRSRTLNLQLTYAGVLPKKLADYLNNPNPAKVFSAFSVIFLDSNGFELLKDTGFLNDFTVKDASGKQAVFKDNLICDFDIYSRISSVIVDFSQ
jgi:hypothetical protein